MFPLSFVSCVLNEEVLRANLLGSPCLGPDLSHETILIKNCPSAATGLNLAIERAEHGWVVFVHQDVCLPEGWDRLLASQLREAERRFGPIGVAGVYGVGEVISPQSPQRRTPIASNNIPRIGVSPNGQVLP